jgi:two-component system, NarL family, sensor histidine kinase DesK
MEAAGTGRSIPVTRLWTAFVVGWLIVLVVIAGMLAGQRYSPPRLAISLLALLLLAGLYLRATLHRAVEPADLAPGGPGARVLRGRLALLGAMVLVVIGLVWLLPAAEPWWLAMHVIVAAGLALPAALAGWVITALIIATMAVAWLVSGHLDPMLLILIAFAAAAVAIRQLTITVAQLREARVALARAAVDQERLRFARDLHDVLGHTLSLISLKSELARRLLPESPAQSAAEIGDVERAAREALHQARSAVAGYHRPVLRLELDAARELLNAAGITAVVDDASGSVEPDLDALIAWGVREGVTNVIRHSRAEHCDIRISRRGHLIELAVADDGLGADPANGSAPGHGLVGLAERVAAHHGVLRAGPGPEGGFTLLLSVPAARTATP